MGRQLKRVPLDFAHPVGQTWTGYLNPHPGSDNCPHCDGTGASPTERRLKDLWYGYLPFKPEDRGSQPFSPDHPRIRALAERNSRPDRGWPGCNVDREAQRLANHYNDSWSHHLNADDVAALLASNRLMDHTHDWTQGDGWKRKEPPYVPTPQEVNDWSVGGGFGHDSINQWVVTSAECKRLGFESMCEHCKGSGQVWASEEIQRVYEAWEQYEPPAGDGYQIWETVSEGSPISPVFATPEELARHMAATKWGADEGTPYATWLEFIRGPGWAPSGMVVNGVYQNGVEAMTAIPSTGTS